jgi:hypothetical protein
VEFSSQKSELLKELDLVPGGSAALRFSEALRLFSQSTHSLVASNRRGGR